MRQLLAVSCALVVLSLAQTSVAQETDQMPDGRFGIGFLGTFPAWGASGIVNVNDRIAVQGVVGAFADLRSFFGRAIYRFNPTRASWGWHNLYGYGMVGAFSYPSVELNENDPDFGKEIRETAPGFGAGVGFEGFLESLPQVGWTVEVGFGLVNFDQIDYNFSAISLGGGIHYYFGGGSK